MTRPTVKSLIEVDLGYCCEWFFFHHFKRTAVIADRLGVSTAAVRNAKARVRSGESVCKGCEGCLHARITLAGDPRKMPLHNRPGGGLPNQRPNGDKPDGLADGGVKDHRPDIASGEG